MKKFTIAICATLIIALLFNTPFTYSQIKSDNTTYMVFSKDIAFKLPAYNTIIYFAENYRFSKFEWDQWNATMIYFYNLQMDGDEVPKFGVSVKNANLTIVDFFVDQRLHVTLDAPSGTISTLTVYCSDYGEPEYIYVEPDSELVSWSYNVSTSLLTVQVKHGSPANITISWVSTPSGEGGPGTSPGTTPTVPTIPQPKGKNSLANFGIIIIVVLIGGAYLYSEISKKKSLSKLWKSEVKKGKKVKWKKRKWWFE